MDLHAPSEACILYLSATPFREAVVRQTALLCTLVLLGLMCQPLFAAGAPAGAAGGQVRAPDEDPATAEPPPPPDPLPEVELPEEVAEFPRMPLKWIKSFKPLIGESRYYVVREPAYVDGPYYRFFVWSVHGEYDVKSMRNLVKITNEIQAIENFRRTETGSQVWKGAGESVKDLGRGVKFIVCHPGQAGKAIGRSFSRFGRKVGRFVSKPFKKGQKKPHGNRMRGVGNFFTGSTARQLAYELGVDVYTENPTMRAVLAEVSNKRWAGHFGTSLAMKIFVPIPGQTWMRKSLTKGARHDATEIMIRNNSSSELKLLNLRKYKMDLGLDNDLIDPLDNLVDNPNYTPREQAYMRLYFTEMRETEGMIDAMAFLAAANTAEEGIHRATQMELLYACHTGLKKIVRWVPMTDQLAGLTEDKTLITSLPWDLVQKTDLSMALVKELSEVRRAQGAREAAVWFTGDVTKDFLTYARQQGVAIHPNMLLLPQFRSGGETATPPGTAE